MRHMLAELGLQTVCTGAHCPNLPECFHRGTATFMILGSTCTRACRFCAVEEADPGPPRDDEPEAVAEASARLNLRHVVITSVTRDDLPDGGAEHFARTVGAVRRRLPDAVIEVLTPDFQGDTEAIDTVLAAGPEIFNHNVETVPRLYPEVRPQAQYDRSLKALAYASSTRRSEGLARRLYTKSGLMVGLGETPDEVRGVLRDLRGADCDIVTIGQYLSPSAAHAPIARFVPPEEFEGLEQEAREMGFAAVAAGPFVRSSYQAEQLFASREEKAT
jgi:lipoic acid synthetase